MKNPESLSFPFVFFAPSCEIFPFPLSTRMLLSVIIPTFNRAHCIRRALASVAAQREAAGDVEIIIGDDASSDDTVAEAVRIMPQVRSVRLPSNHGAAAARNAAMKIASGEFLAFLDSDDEWLPGKLERQLAYLRDHPECAVCGTGHFLETKSGERIEFPGKNPSDWRRELHLAQSFHGASTPLVRRSVLADIGSECWKIGTGCSVLRVNTLSMCFRRY